MPKLKSAIQSAIKPTSIKTKRPKGSSPRGGRKGNRNTAKGGLLTVHHPPGASPKEGVDERRTMLKWRAMELKIQGKTLRQIALQIQEDFELVKSPAHVDIDRWLDEAFADTVTAREMDAERHCSLIIMRGEALISELLPVALGKVEIRRTRMRDGKEIEIIDDKFLSERIAATGEIRKLMDQRAKILKIGRMGEGKEADGPQVTGHALTLIVEKTVTNNILFPGQRPSHPVGAALMLESGDRDIDALDAEAVEAYVTAPI